MSDRELSPALKLVKFVYENARASEFTAKWRFNSMMRSAIALAAQGLRFEKDDFSRHFLESREDRRLGHWLVGDWRVYGEWFYWIVCERRNLSACQAFERWKGRKPFIYEGQRIYVERRLYLSIGGKRQWVKCTSLADNKSYIVVKAESKESKRGFKLHRITLGEIRQMERERKLRQGGER